MEDGVTVIVWKQSIKNCFKKKKKKPNNNKISYGAMEKASYFVQDGGDRKLASGGAERSVAVK